MDKNLKVVFWKGTTPTTFEVEVKYTSEDVEKLFGITYLETKKVNKQDHKEQLLI